MRVHFQEDSYRYRIMGIDNGTGQLGMSIMDYDLRTGVGRVLHTEAFVPEVYAYSRFGSTVAMRSKVTARIRYTRDWMRDRLYEFQPHVVGCESPFSHDRVHAFAILTLQMESLADVVEQYDNTLDFIKVSPGSAKKSVLHNDQRYANAKEAVRESILTHPDIIIEDHIDPRRITSDEMDSIAVGWCAGEAARPFIR